MEKKEEKLLFFRIFLVVLIIFFINTGSFIYKNKDSIDISNKGLTGFSVKTTVSSYKEMNSVSKILLLTQWFVLIALLLIVSIKDRKTKKQNSEIKQIHIAPNKQKTDLDSLYEILKDKKQLSILTISKSFNVDKDVAMEWGKILESGNLATIDYPLFGGPVIKLYEKKTEILKEEKDKNKNLKIFKKNELEKTKIKNTKSKTKKKLEIKNEKRN